jgi:hypothetical protein
MCTIKLSTVYDYWYVFDINTEVTYSNFVYSLTVKCLVGSDYYDITMKVIVMIIMMMIIQLVFYNFKILMSRVLILEPG